MNAPFRFAGLRLALFLISSAVVLFAALSFSLNFRVMLLMLVMSAIVAVSATVLYAFGRSNVIGFFFLGTVVFKMFGMGYIAYFEHDFKNNVIAYFIVFWIFLLMEAALVASMVPKHDINHKK